MKQKNSDQGLPGVEIVLALSSFKFKVRFKFVASLGEYTAYVRVSNFLRAFRIVVVNCDRNLY